MTMNTKSLQTTFGDVTLNANGYPDEHGIATLFDELDRRHACQASVWGLPALGIEGQLLMQKHFGSTGAGGSLMRWEPSRVLGIATLPNISVAYVATLANLLETGPLVLENPAGQTTGIVMDYQQRWIADVGLTGPARGQHERVLILAHGQERPARADGYRIVRSQTPAFLHCTRILHPKRDLATLPPKFRMYPFAERARRKPRVISAHKDMSMTQSVGMACWHRLFASIQREPVAERDRLIFAMLIPNGSEAGVVPTGSRIVPWPITPLNRDRYSA